MRARKSVSVSRQAISNGLTTEGHAKPSPFLCALCGAPVEQWSCEEPIPPKSTSSHPCDAAYRQRPDGDCNQPANHQHASSVIQQGDHRHEPGYQRAAARGTQGQPPVVSQQPQEAGPQPHQQPDPRVTLKRQPGRTTGGCACGGCGALYYCCEAHRSRHARVPGGHSPAECDRLAAQVRRGPLLAADFPFPWFRSISFGTFRSDNATALDVGGQGDLSSYSHRMAEKTVAAASPPPPPLRPQLTVCELLESVQPEAHGRSRDGVAGAAVRQQPSPPAAETAVSGGSGGSAAAGDGTGGGATRAGDGGSGRCTAPGCWRRVCGCGAEDETGRTTGADDDGPDWGSRQRPLLGRLGPPHRRRPAHSEPPQGQPPHSPPYWPRPGDCSAVAWDRATWAQQVWHLPPHMAPPLGGPVVHWADGGGQSVRPPGPSGEPLRPEVALPLAANGHQTATSLSGRDGDGCGGGVVDWMSYYRWAGLPLESPAALLLHFPLSLYGALRLVDERLDGRLLRRGSGSGFAGAAAALAAGSGASDAAPPAAGRQGRGFTESWADSPAAKRQRTSLEQGPDQPLGQPGCTAAASAAELRERETAGWAAGDVRQSAATGQEGAQHEVHRHHPELLEGQTLPPSGAMGCSVVSAAGRSAAVGMTSGGGSGSSRWRLDVLYLGPQAELDQLDTFAVLLPLLPPGCTLRLHMVGPDVPPDLHDTVLVYDGPALGVTATVREHSAMVREGVDCRDTDQAGKGREGPRQGLGAQDCNVRRPVTATVPPVMETASRGGTCGEDVLHPHAHHVVHGIAWGMASPRLELAFHSCLLHEAADLLLGADDVGSRTPPGSNGAEQGGFEDVTAEAAAVATAEPGDVCAGDDSDEGAGVVPLVVFAPNAGLPVYLSWLPSLELLLSHRQQQDPEQQRQLQRQQQQRPTGLSQRDVEAPSRLDGSKAVVSGAALSASPGRGSEQHASGEVLGPTGTHITACDTGDFPTAPTVGAEANTLVETPGCRRGRRTPLACIFTAFNEEECELSCRMLDEVYGIRPDVRMALNPFRQPLWCVGRTGNGLPSYSNGFMYGWLSV